MTTAGDLWRETVRALAVPQEILDRSPEPEATLEPERFRWRPDEDAKAPVRPSRRRALEALPEGGTVLDIGVGGGASSFGLAGRAGLIVGVDTSQGMLDQFQATGRELGVATRTVLGPWPDVAGEVAATLADLGEAADVADVAVCHHAMYGAAEVEAFVTAMTAAARHRCVLELSARSPLTAFNELWKRFHGLDRPNPDVADQAEAVLRELGLAVEREDMVLPGRAVDVTPQMVAFVRRRLHVGEDRDAEIEEVLRAREPADHRVAALWWPGAPTGS